MSGPLLVVQLLETPLLCLVSYARWGPGWGPRPKAGSCEWEGPSRRACGAWPRGGGVGVERWPAPAPSSQGLQRDLAE